MRHPWITTRPQRSDCGRMGDDMLGSGPARDEEE
jgi:hypothetical protein